MQLNFKTSRSCVSRSKHSRNIKMTVAATTSTAVAQVSLLKKSNGIDFTQLRGALFDVDGTLGNSEPLHFRVYQETLLELNFNNGVPITHDWFQKHIAGRHNPLITADLFPEKTIQWREEWSDMREARFRKLAEQELEPINGMKAFADWVAGKALRRAAVTNAPRPNAEVMIKGLGLDTFFETLVIGDECQRGKPYPDPYLVGLVKIGLQHAPHQVVVLEDSPTGIQAGVAAGLKVVAIASSDRPHDDLYKAGATLVVNDYEQLLSVIHEQEQVSQKACQ